MFEVIVVVPAVSMVFMERMIKIGGDARRDAGTHV
jgi:hypothetical protein